MPSRSVIERFLGQRKLAVVGVSRNPKEFANAVYRHLREGGRVLYPVNPYAAGEQLEGDLCYAALHDIPDVVDGVLVMVKPDVAEQVVRECIALHVPRVWLHRGAGTGAVSPAAVQLCRDAGVEVVDGACPMMFADPIGFGHKVHGFFAKRKLTA